MLERWRLPEIKNHGYPSRYYINPEFASVDTPFSGWGFIVCAIGRVIVARAAFCAYSRFLLVAGGSLNWPPAFQKESNASTMLSATLFEDKNMVKTKGCIQHICEYVCVGRCYNWVLLLTGSVYAMSIIAGNLGTLAFAAIK